ncbi:hypothetical protein C5Y41_09585 [Rahnella variigena]|uniref:polysaccharide pyruvyl transferase family protein n=1 Tax=Rahnella variigena TaxID=574964 RepID=UPI00101B8D10|nr:polysaccharide pyruvyl transferase family protein [Rahnella variigena]RYJ17464.1 hypothetical protein C5Y41_09585 [Rahnella variigena]
MKINLIGAVGGGNFGDEFILNSCITEYSKMNRATIFVSGFNDGLILKNNCAVITEKTNFFQVMMNLKKETAGGLYLSFEQIAASFESLETFDLIHFIGGGYINSLWPNNYALLAIAYMYAKLHEIPIYATGLGLYPFVEDEKLQDLFESLSVIDVRDKESKYFIPTASYTGDDALLEFYNIEQLSRIEDVPSLIISLQSHLFDGALQMKNLLSDDFFALLRKKKLKKIIIIEAAPEDNIAIPRELYNHALNYGLEIEFCSGSELIKNGLPLNKKSFVVSSRYHINLLYSMLGIAGIAVYGNDYYKNKHESIIDMGGGWEVINQENIKNALYSWLSFNDYEDMDKSKMESIASAKKSLFSNIIDNTPTMSTKNMSLEGALAIVNEYIVK